MAIYKITNVGANKCLNIYGNNVTSLKKSKKKCRGYCVKHITGATSNMFV